MVDEGVPPACKSVDLLLGWVGNKPARTLLAPAN